VRNAATSSKAFDARFRVSGKIAEQWDAVTGEVRPASYRMEQGHMIVPLTLGPEESRFIIFRKPAQTNALVIPAETKGQAEAIAGPWSVNFEAGRGAPATTSMGTLTPLNENPDPGIRYFSGIATYRSSFNLTELKPGQKLMLDLGRVGDIAEVRVNGQLAGTAWQAPYALDISDLVRSGNNSLEIAVANLWVNRLIGDAQAGATKVGWTAVPMYKADAPLRPAGLIGPVNVLQYSPAN
jgi:hypothetical protein